MVYQQREIEPFVGRGEAANVVQAKRPPLRLVERVQPTAIVYGGRRFTASAEMIQIFLRHARELIENGESELVPLLHSEGVDLLLISRATPYSLGVAAEVES